MSVTNPMSWTSLTDVASTLGAYLKAVVVSNFISPAGAFAATSLFAAFVIAAAYLLARRRPGSRPIPLAVLLRALIPHRWWRTPSARADLWLGGFNIFLFGILFGWAVISGQVISQALSSQLAGIFGAPSLAPVPDWMTMAIVTLVLFLGYELGYWIDHYLVHRVPFLWEFHKVHHSAETLSPLTNARMHPVDTVIFYNIAAVVTGLFGGIAYYFLGRRVPEATIFSANAIAFVFGYLTNHLQHSHMWIPFTGVWGRLLISPAHHQIHHSTNPIHFDKNLGSSLAIFDWLFGTLHVPARERERLNFGIEPQTVSPHSVEGALIHPVREALAQVVSSSTSAPKSTALPGQGASR